MDTSEGTLRMPGSQTLDNREAGPEDGPGIGSGAGSRSRRERWATRRTALALLLVALLTTLTVSGWWWRHPTAFDPAPERSNVGMGERRPISEGPMHIGTVWPVNQSSASAELRSAEPRVLVNTARARIDVRVCERRTAETVYSFSGGLDRFCTLLSDVDGATLTWDDNGMGDRYVIMTIRPRRVGEVRVQGIDLTYRDGLQSGTQQVGEHVWLRYVRR